MPGGFKGFTFYEPNPNRSWDLTPTMLGLVLYAGASSRAKACELANFVDVISWVDEGRDDVITAQVLGSDCYDVRLNFGSRIMHCDCPSFEHRGGPCKHIAAVALRMVSDHEGGGPAHWARAAVLESRNAGDHFKLWELRPALTEKMARTHNVDIIEVQQCIQKVTGFMLRNGKIWTGTLPLPVRGERVLAYLPNQEQVPATVVEAFNGDETYQAYHIKMDWIPDGYTDEDTIVFGSEMLRGANVC